MIAPDEVDFGEDYRASERGRKSLDVWDRISIGHRGHR